MGTVVVRRPELPDPVGRQVQSAARSTSLTAPLDPFTDKPPLVRRRLRDDVAPVAESGGPRGAAGLVALGAPLGDVTHGRRRSALRTPKPEYVPIFHFPGTRSPVLRAISPVFTTSGESTKVHWDGPTFELYDARFVGPQETVAEPI